MTAPSWAVISEDDGEGLTFHTALVGVTTARLDGDVATADVAVEAEQILDGSDETPHVRITDGVHAADLLVLTPDEARILAALLLAAADAIDGEA